MTLPTNAERALVDTVLALKHVYTDEGIGVWLSAAQGRWNGESAYALIRRGEGDRVVQAAWQLADGAYA